MKEIQCLNYGFVRLVDVMGNDTAIVQAARTSFGQGAKSKSEDRTLIRYLMRNRHTSPFEMVEFKFHCKMPIFVARQWIRHRTANVNEFSGRYSEMPDEFYVPGSDLVRMQSMDNKQGRCEDVLPKELTDGVVAQMADSQRTDFNEYRELIDKGIARELARINLPLSIYTQWYWKIDLHNLFHFLKLRLDKHSQYEIRVYAEAIAEIVKECCPVAYEAFADYQLDTISLSKVEQKALAMLLKGNALSDELLATCGLGKRESAEFMKKMESL
ncbi:MAG: FAD-dependent thymidylate synthase [Ignavibacteria bacterium]|jgi:thymidylate synthase (FAD)|nr:FAD-dependent thymidylate synthase [Ignavibacteria bacterium]